MHICQLTAADVPNLIQINPSFTSDAELALEKLQTDLQEITWRLTYRPLKTPFDKGHGYDLRGDELAAIKQRLQSGKCLQLVAKDNDRIVGLLEVEPSDWRAVGWIWNILIDKDYRQRGLGRQFICQAVAWAKERNLQALVAETQTNNINACRFYAHMGFVPGGIDDHYYRYCTNPQAAQEVAIFWYLEISLFPKGEFCT